MSHDRTEQVTYDDYGTHTVWTLIPLKFTMPELPCRICGGTEYYHSDAGCVACAKRRATASAKRKRDRRRLASGNVASP